MGNAKKNADGLTDQQVIFVNSYAGDATAAAKAAGYSRPTQYGCYLLTIPKVQEAIKKHSKFAESAEDGLKTKEDRRRLYAEIMNDPKATRTEKMRAAELDGKTCGDFIERRIIDDRRKKGPTFWEIMLEHEQEIRVSHTEVCEVEERPGGVCDGSVQVAEGPKALPPADDGSESD
jgi:hypothetical protein